MSDPKTKPDEANPEQPTSAKPAEKPLLMKAPYDPDEEEEIHVCCSDPRHQHR